MAPTPHRARTGRSAITSARAHLAWRRLRVGRARRDPRAAGGLSPEQLRATAERGTPLSSAWQPRHAALLHAVDELHDTARLSQPAWDALRVHYEDAQLLELLVLTGWYRTISYLANGLLIEEEPWGARFPAP